MRLGRLKTLALICLLPGCAQMQPGQAQTAPQVETGLGAVAGERRGEAEVFWGLPYAAPPTGEARWRPPAPAAPWEGMRQATEKPAICPQSLREVHAPIRGATRQDEDCLYLNVWRPEGTGPEDRLPVMVWIHGGNFRSGAGSWDIYDGHAFTSRDTILVTLNYRLGVLGRFAHPALLEEQPDGPWANYALMDQVAALEWIQGNIPAFGGDPENVTLFGYSAGGVSINYLMTAPAAEGLFHRAISQSGGIQVEGSRELLEPGVERLRKPLIEEGIEMADSLRAPTLEELRAMPVDLLIEWQDENIIGSLNPVRDGVLIPQSVGRAFAEGNIHGVDYLAGATDWEASLIAGVAIPPMAILGLVSDLDSVRAAYPGLDDAALAQAWFADNTFVGPARFLAHEHARHEKGRTWLYSFEYVAEAVRGSVPGAAHSNDVPYVFESLPGKNRGLSPEDITDSDRAFAALMADYWTQFARTGDPNGPGLPDWPAHQPARDAWMRLSPEPSPHMGYRAALMGFLDARYRAFIEDGGPEPSDQSP